MKRVKKNALLNFGWTIDEIDEADYFELLDIMSAKDEEDQEVDPMSLVKGGN